MHAHGGDEPAPSGAPAGRFSDLIEEHAGGIKASLPF